MQAKPRLLLLSHVQPLSRQSGQEQRVYYSLVALREKFQVTFLTFTNRADVQSVKTRIGELCHSAEVLPSRYTSSQAAKRVHRLLGAWHQWRTGLKFSNYLIGRVEFTAKRIAALLQDNQYDLALFEYFHAADRTTEFHAWRTRCVLDMHNVLWRSYARQLLNKPMPLAQRQFAIERYRTLEEQSWNKFDALIAITPGERDYVRGRLASDKPVFYAPMGIPLNEWPFCPKPGPVPRLAYYGGLGSSHNAADARQCCDEIMPVIWKRFPDAQLWIVGSHPPPDLVSRTHQEPRVKVTGFLSRPQDVLNSASALLCPFRGKYGFRSRLIEAMALGLPVIASHDAVYGMDLQEDEGLILADSSELMAAAAVRLISDRDLALQHSRHARAQVEAKYSFDATYGQLADDLLRFARSK